MKVIEHIEKAKETLLSIEIVPPERGKNINAITDIIDALSQYQPSWIDVTAHSSVANYHENGDGSLERKIYKKRPGTIGICGVIQNRYNIDTVAHLLCDGFTKEETEDALIELNFLGVNNVLALKGDSLNYKKSVSRDRSVNNYACDLVEQVSNMKNGVFLNELADSKFLDFGIGVAGYPEKHFEAPSLRSDIKYLKQKVDKGAEYIVTQMFFDNQCYFDFVDLCRSAGITVPIVPGLKIIRNARQLKSLAKSFHISIPDELIDEITENQERAFDIGIEWSIRQCQELLEHNVPSLHFYIMNDEKSLLQVLKGIKR
ncbi:MAG: methylenetetrahydrofolate reductase [Bacteriovoracaceae bacterium]